MTSSCHTLPPRYNHNHLMWAYMSDSNVGWYVVCNVRNGASRTADYLKYLSYLCVREIFQNKPEFLPCFL